MNRLFPLGFALLCFSANIGQAEVVIDTQAHDSGDISLGTADNDVPVVNITAPNNSGLSHNQFLQYNVGENHLILNNQRAEGTTELGGIVPANPHLNDASAALILNEVTGPQATDLLGFTEVAGSAAEVIVANPNGITCRGCGFINTPAATLTTGIPRIQGGLLQQFSVHQGTVQIGGAGLNASGVERLAIMARNIEVDAPLLARDLNLIAGLNDIDYPGLTVHTRESVGAGTPELAIDSAALGGMYANTINLVATESGVGVALAGDMVTDTGDVTLQADGTIVINRVVAESDLTVASQSADIEVQSGAYGSGVQMEAGGDLLNQGVVASTASSAEGSDSLAISVSGAVVNEGSFSAVNDMDIAAQSLTNQYEATITAQGNATVQTAGDVTNQGVITSSGNLAVRADNILNQSVVGSGGTLYMEAENRLTNSNMGEHGAPLELDSPYFNTEAPTVGKDGTLIFAVEDMVLLGNEVLNQYADIYTFGDLAIAKNAQGASSSLVHNSSGTMEATGDLIIVADEVKNYRDPIEEFDHSELCDTVDWSLVCHPHYGFGYFEWGGYDLFNDYRFQIFGGQDLGVPNGTPLTSAWLFDDLFAVDQGYWGGGS